MKLLAVLFLVGLGLAYANPTSSDKKLSLDHANDLDYLLSFSVEDGDDDEIKTELVKKLKESLEVILQEIKDAVEHGKKVKEETIERMKRIHQKLIDMKEDIGEHTKRAILKLKDYLKDKFGGWIDKLKDALGLKSDRRQRRDIKEEIINKLKEAMDKAMEKLKNAIDKGETIKEEWIEKFKNLCEKLQSLGFKMREKLLELREQAKGKLREIIDKVLKKLDHKDESEVLVFADENKFEIDFDTPEMKHIKDALDVCIRMANLGMYIPKMFIEKFISLCCKLSYEAMQAIKSYLENTYGNSEGRLRKLIDDIIKLLDECIKDKESQRSDLGDGLKVLFDKALERVKQMFEKGEELKESMVEKMREMIERGKKIGLDFKQHALNFYEKLEGKAKENFRKLLERLGIKEGSEDLIFADENKIQSSEMGEIMFKTIKRFIENCLLAVKLPFVSYDMFLDKFSELYAELPEQYKSKVLEFLYQLKKSANGRVLEFLEEMLEHVKEEDERKLEKRSIKDIREKIAEFFKDLGLKMKENYLKFGQWVKKLVDEGLQLGKDKAENVKKIAEEFLKHGKDLTKDVVNEFQEFIEDYKKELGNLYEECKKEIKKIFDGKY